MTISSENFTSIPLNKLVAWNGNVRKTDITEDIDQLQASIAANGVLQSLVVRKTAKGKFAVIAGNRRFLALSALAEGGTITEDAPVPCTVITKSANATEISLTENVVRTPMHPADQFEAFRDLMDDGLSVTDIAARFGISEIAVKRLLKLARVSKVIFQAYRDGKLTLQQVQAFAVSDDHEAQDALFAGITQWSGRPAEIRNALTQGEIRATDKRAGFITVAMYEEAGGAVRRDLFAEGDEGVFLLDAELLDRLVLERLALEAEKLKAEGWKWTEAVPELDRSEMNFRERRPEPLPLSEAAAAEQKKLVEEYKTLFESADEHDEETTERLDEIERRVEQIDDEAETAYTPDVLAIAGAIATIDHDGELEILRGLARPEDEPESEGSPQSSGLPKERPEFSSKLVESLTAAKSAAIGAALTENTSVALAAVVHAFALQVFDAYRSGDVIEISGKVTRYKEESEGASELDRIRDKWGDMLPGAQADLWDWCLAQEQSTLLELLAFCTACTVNTVETKYDRLAAERPTHAKALASALNLDMTRWFTPTAENFFSRVGRATIVNALTEAKNTPAKRSWEKLKKSEIAALAEREIAGTKWLPQLFRA